jgi:hypothetical protein
MFKKTLLIFKFLFFLNLDEGGSLQIWRVDANILNNQSQTACRSGEGANNSSPACYERFIRMETAAGLL